jgi:hypothetical protein
VEKEARNAIERATQRARKLLEEDFSAQLEGDFDVHRNGVVAATAGAHLSVRQTYLRERIIAAIEHKRVGGMSAADAVSDYIRDAAFTTLNRYSALKMLEARGLTQECISRGEQSAGYREFCGMAPGLQLQADGSGYRLYIESIFDELATEVKVLFDRRDPSSLLWPNRGTFEKLLAALNEQELSLVWDQDETIGWIYQFFNGQDERRKMRDESQSPRNSRELAVRNQFFTPRYVVQFLTDNTLGRIWCEMRGEDTSLVSRCEYLVRTGEKNKGTRKKKDPRDIRVLDPACGSGHFLLYAFDVFLPIYEEAYLDPSSPKSESTGQSIAQDYESLDALRKAVPGLILQHNIHGVDIDARCTQISQLALWMRAQRYFHDLGLARGARPKIRRASIYVAEALAIDPVIEENFLAGVGDAGLTSMFRRLVDRLKLAGDLGLLLRLEEQGSNVQKVDCGLNIVDSSKERIRKALSFFVPERGARNETRDRLFVEDANRGLGIFQIAETKFDVTLMNPPFGDSTPASREVLTELYPAGRLDLYACFVQSALSRTAPGGRVGVLSSRLGLFLGSLENWREHVFMGGQGRIELLADLGHNVLDDALVEAAAYVVGLDINEKNETWACGLLSEENKALALKKAVESPDKFFREKLVSLAQSLPGKPLPYWLPRSVIEHLTSHDSLSKIRASALVGIQTDDDFRFLRLAWEVKIEKDIESDGWRLLAKGGEYSPYYDDIHLLINWKCSASEIRAFIEQRYSWTKNARSVSRYGEAGLTYPERTTSEFSPRPLPAGSIFSIAGPAILTSESKDAFALLALFYTRWYRLLIEAFVGGGDAVQAGSAARHYKTGIINKLPLPDRQGDDWKRLADIGVKCSISRAREFTLDETSRVFEGYSRLTCDWEEYAARELLKMEEGLCIRESLSFEAESLIAKSFSLRASDIQYIQKEYGPHPSELSENTQGPVLGLLNEDYSAVCARVVQKRGFSRQSTKLSHWTHKVYEAVAQLEGIKVASVVARRRKEGGLPNWWVSDLAANLLSYWVGVAFGRWNLQSGGREQLTESHLTKLPQMPFASIGAKLSRIVLVDDEGGRDDICDSLIAASGVSIDEIERVVSSTTSSGIDLRKYLRSHFFTRHISQYSKSRRKAPVYWQLATPSASYSVWLYIHAFTKDTLFRVQNDYIAPKLAHEERRLDSLISEIRNGATATQRKQLVAQEAFVEELRAFLDEVKRVTPLWCPNLDDGVIINFAPLWRLVPQNKSWQKELKTMWDALCEGEYDWAHLAMYLWPERVLPKCAKDRSLAIAHELEEVFWFKDSEGKYSQVKAPTKSLDQLIREKTSPAVKAALNSLLNAPVQGGAKKSAKRGKTNG